MFPPESSGSDMAKVLISIEDVGDPENSNVSFIVVFDPRPSTAAVEDLTPAQVMGAHVADFAQEWMKDHGEELTSVARGTPMVGGSGVQLN